MIWLSRANGLPLFRTLSVSNVSDFALKITNSGKSVINLVEMQFAVRKMMAVIWVTCVQKNPRIQTWIKQLLAKYRLLNVPNFIYRPIHKNHNFQVIWIFLNQLLLHVPYKFYASRMRRKLFSILPVVSSAHWVTKILEWTQYHVE